MRRFERLGAVVTGAVTMAAASSTAMANPLGLIDGGYGGDANSWSWNWGLNVGAPGIDVATMAWQINSAGGAFESPAIVVNGTNPPGALSSWGELPLSAPYASTNAVVAGDAVSGLLALQWTTTFAGATTDWSPGNLLEIDVAFFDSSDQLNLTVRIWFNGSTWQIAQFADWFGSSPLADGYWLPTIDDVNAMVIPLPAPVLMGLTGLAGLVVVRGRSGYRRRGAES